jgi:hypothetical protein
MKNTKYIQLKTGERTLLWENNLAYLMGEGLIEVQPEDISHEVSLIFCNGCFKKNITVDSFGDDSDLTYKCSDCFL